MRRLQPTDFGSAKVVSIEWVEARGYSETERGFGAKMHYLLVEIIAKGLLRVKG